MFMVETSKKNNNDNNVFKNWKTILAMFAILVLVFEMIFIGFNNLPSLFKWSNPQTKLGTIEFSGSIRTYEPYIFIPSQKIDADIFEKIRSLPGVSDVSTKNEGILIKVETRDDVYPVALALKKMGFTPYGIANVVAPSVVSVVLDENGQRMNASLREGAIRVETQPIIPVDSTVTVSAKVALNDKTIVQYGGAVLKTEKKPISAAAKIENKIFKYVFYVPWEERNSLPALDDVNWTYTRNDIAIFENELSTDQIIAIKNFDYVVYVDKNSVVFSQNFTDKQRAISDFGVNLSFSPSILVVETNHSFSLQYPSNFSYVYTLRPEFENYSFASGEDIITVESAENINGESVNLSGIVTAVGNAILDIENVSISQ